MIELYLDIQPALRALRKLQARLKNQKILMDEIGDYMEGRILEGFRKERDPYNKKWAALSPATISEKQRKGYPRNILVATGKMKKSVKIRVYRKSLRIDVGFPAKFHQRGTRKMPQRMIIPEGKLSRTDQRNIQDIAIDYLDI